MIFRELVNGLLFIIIICCLLDAEAAVLGLDITFSCVMCPAQPIRIRSRPTLALLFIFFIYLPVARCVPGQSFDMDMDSGFNKIRTAADLSGFMALLKLIGKY